MSYLERLEQSARTSGNLLCLGLDPVPERIEPLGLDIETFLGRILERLEADGCLPSTLKPNLAYFEQFGSKGWAILERLLESWAPKCLIIADAKRGDIGRSSEAYARAMFEHLGADAVTVSPWMGADSIAPFLDRAPQRGTYLLVRTSNPGHADLQAACWQSLATRVREWKAGAVVGATSVQDLSRAIELLGPEVPLLIPGVGTQGGEASEVMQALGQEPWRHRVNVSSAILYAFEQSPGLDFAEAAAQAARHYAAALNL
ncbi:MAG: orotidine-5'-phosphate decarboxylase [Candidatus Eremiobacteraeota bacterium]|nr:orotidine-5'-phosphate decarboxylase [Candidatus Eremiobacteraeota bacterium]